MDYIDIVKLFEKRCLDIDNLWKVKKFYEEFEKIAIEISNMPMDGDFRRRAILRLRDTLNLIETGLLQNQELEDGCVRKSIKPIYHTPKPGPDTVLGDDSLPLDPGTFIQR